MIIKGFQFEMETIQVDIAGKLFDVIITIGDKKKRFFGVHKEDIIKMLPASYCTKGNITKIMEL